MSTQLSQSLISGWLKRNTLQVLIFCVYASHFLVFISFSLKLILYKTCLICRNGLHLYVFSKFRLLYYFPDLISITYLFIRNVIEHSFVTEHLSVYRYNARCYNLCIFSAVWDRNILAHLTLIIRFRLL